MVPTHSRGLAAALLAAAAATACSRATSVAPHAGTPAHADAIDAGEAAAIAKARADSARYPYTAADIHFMSAMIGHHAQAIKMAGWAESHGASPSVRTLAERIINAQHDEIVTMQRWLRDRNQPVPDPSQMEMGMKMKMDDGTEHVMLMPGMLTEEQMRELDAARGKDFDRLFLTDMIQHHRGAITMVKELFDTYGAAQDELVFKFASDVNVDQTTEVARMQRMLFMLDLQEGRSP